MIRSRRPNSLFLLFVVFGIPTDIQQGKSAFPEKVAVSQTEYGTFENFAFVLNGKVIQQHALADYPGAVLDKIYSYGNIELEGRKYRGAVYFHTPKHPAPPVPYADDPAWFINGRQVSPFDIRSSRPELYTRITKSASDTLIDGNRYRGSIYVDTDEDFFSGRIALPEVLSRYADLPAEQVIVHWYSRLPMSARASDISMVIPGHFPIYYLDKSDSSRVKVNSIRFAEGERYVVHLMDGRYNQVNFSSNKARAIFEAPLTVDPDCTCYLDRFDSTSVDIFNAVELMPEPYEGEEAYLKKLSATMGLPAEKPAAPMVSDSITVRFFLTRSAMLAKLESTGSDKPGHAQILYAIKRNSCIWSAGIQGGRLVPATRRKMTINYSRDKKGAIRSLESIKFH